MSDEDRVNSGKIFRTSKDGKPILWTLVREMPSEATRASLPWLTVVSWAYDGSSRNGMPPSDVNATMLHFERALTDLERPDFCVEAYRRIGNDLREFVLYVADREGFMSALNAGLADHPLYPIEIKFYEDGAWSELLDLIDDLSPSSSVGGEGSHDPNA